METHLSNNKFEQEYFTSGNYKDYLGRRESYHKLATEIVLFLQSIGLYSRKDKITDFGCGCGFLVEELLNHYDNVLGYDISKWAIQYGNLLDIEPLTNNINCLLERVGGITIALDVFEHMEESELYQSLSTLEPKFLIIRVPVTRVEGGSYILPVSNNDPTHILKYTKQTWNNVLNSLGFQMLVKINRARIFDSEGVLAAIYVNSKHKAYQDV